MERDTSGKGTPVADTLYARVGGDAFFVALIDRFYVAVEMDSVLRPLYPKDLTPGKARLAGFLIQYWGGPATYSEQRGAPRLRMRHLPFSIGQPERDAWVRHITIAVQASGAAKKDQVLLLRYFEQTATFMMNRS